MSDRGQDVLIGLGAQKAGTTSVWVALKRQSWFLPAREKELHHFSLTPDRPTAWYWRQFPPPRDGHVRGEISPDYLRVPQAAHRIHRVAPEARLFAILRHPVDRAYSAYLHGRRVGDIPRRMTFDEALAREATRRGRPFSELFEGGLYARQLRRFLELFPADRLHVELFDDVVAEDGEGLRRILRFANPAVGDAVVGPLPRRNVARSPLPYGIAAVWTRAARVATVRGRHDVARRLRGLEARWDAPGRAEVPPLDPRTRARLIDRYAPENMALSALIGRPLPGWDR